MSLDDCQAKACDSSLCRWRWVHETFPQLKLFAWQQGNSAFSVCKRCEARVIPYIRNQDARHDPTRKGPGPTREGGVNEG